MLNAAKALIPIFWKTTKVPTITQWLEKVSEIREMEDTLTQASDNVDKFHETWSPWFEFRFSKAYEALMGTG